MAAASELLHWSDQSPDAQVLLNTATTQEEFKKVACFETQITLHDNRLAAPLNTKACVSYGKDFRLAYKGDYTYLSTGAENDYYKVGTGRSSLFIAPQTNRAILTVYQPHLFVDRLQIYDNLMDALTPRFDPGGEYYSLSYKQPDYPKNDEFIGITSLGFSSNGRYMVFAWGREDVSFFKIDLETKEQTAIETVGETGSPASYAISDDGKYIAVGNHELRIWTDDPSTCRNTRDRNEEYGTSSCKYKRYMHYQLGMGDVESSRSFGFRSLRFTNNAARLEGVFVADGQYKRQIILQSPNYVSTSSLNYLALGDSYSSGEGDTELNKGVKYYRLNTDTEEDSAASRPREKCHVSTRSYPNILAAAEGIVKELWDTVACSGAQSYDVTSQDSNDYKGQGKGGGDGGKPRLEGYDYQQLKSYGLNEMIPGRQKQIEFVKRYKPKVITLTMGGNDIGFGDRVRQCVIGVTTCATSRAKTSIASEIKQQFDVLKRLYDELLLASGHQAKIYVLGYPQFINNDSTKNCGMNVGLIDDAERDMMVNGVTYYNNVIKAASQASGVKYIDIEHSLDGHRLCDTDKSYVTGVAFRGKSELQESYHPSAKAHELVARSFKRPENIGDVSLFGYNYCADGRIACPDPTVTKNSPAVPQYFGGSISSVNSQYKIFTSPIQPVKEALRIVLDSYTLKPNSIVTLTRYSEPFSIGRYEVESDGSLDTLVQLPIDTDVGYHTITIDGETVSGEPITYEQIILVTGGLADQDADGTNDSDDPCLFITPARTDVDGDKIDDACDPLIGDPAILQPKEKEAYKESNSTTQRSKVASLSIVDSKNIAQNQAGKIAQATTLPPEKKGSVIERLKILPRANNDSTISHPKEKAATISKKGIESRGLWKTIFAIGGGVIVLLVTWKLIRHEDI